jgi:hypothetical protein
MELTRGSYAVDARGFDIVLAFPGSTGEKLPHLPQNSLARQLDACGFELRAVSGSRALCVRMRSADDMATLAERIGLKKRLAGADRTYVPFSRHAEQSTWARPGGQLFTSAERIQLCLTKLQEPRRRGGAELSLDALVAEGQLLDWWALHDDGELEALRALWASLGGDTWRGRLAWGVRKLRGEETRQEVSSIRTERILVAAAALTASVLPFAASRSRQFIDAVRDYCGPRAAVYLAFLQLSTHWLRYPAAFGTVLSAYSMAVSTVDLNVANVFGLYVIVWSFRFIKEWRRTENELALRWSVDNVADAELPRPAFVGEERCGFYERVRHTSPRSP